MMRSAYTPDELAERWGCSGNHVRAMIRSNKLPAFRLGKLYRVPISAVEEYEACASTASPSTEENGPSPEKEARRAASLAARLALLNPRSHHDK